MATKLTDIIHSSALCKWNIIYIYITIFVDFLMFAGRHQESLEIAARGLKYLPKNDLLHFNLGNIYARYEEWLKSETHYLMAVKLNPGNSMFYANLGTCI